MTTLRTLLAALLTAFGLVALTPAAAHACSCAGGSTEQYTKWADAVFTGRLTDVDPPPRRPVMSSGDPVMYHFEVHEVLKGDVGAEAEVTSAVSSASCGLEHMSVDQEYVVYATGDRELSTGLCGGTSPTAPAKVEGREHLTGPAHAPSAAAAEPDTSDAGSATTWAVVGVAGLLAAAAAGLAIRRR